jgi:aminoglycoside 6'-N-acetyltransferase I
MHIRPVAPADVAALAALRLALWPNGTLAEHETEARAQALGQPLSTMPLTTLVADDGELVGFAEVGLRSHADGCNAERPVGYLEGWFVVPARRGQGIGRALVAAAEDWARAQGCREMASDTWLDNEGSQRAHAALGFEVVDRCVHFRKPL